MGALFVDLPHDSVRNGGYIELRLDKDGAIRYRQTLFLKPEERSFSVQFFPEGGELVGNVPRLVAFKAEGSDGYPVDFSGTVLNGNGDSLVRFRSEHDGMGTFLFCPQQGETYRVICESAGRRITLPLPAVVEHACALTVVRGPEHIRYRVDGPLPSGALLVGHIRGDCCCVAALSDQRPSGAIPIDSLAEGVLHLLLIDSAGYPLSERLVFVGKPQSGVGWEAVPDRLRYGRRERVRLEIAQTGVSERFLPDNLSVSVTNRNVMKGDSLGDDIRTNLLLTSDLKGYIHNPGYYFLDDSPGRRYHLDLVMLTHGWRRFSTKNLFSPSAFSPEHFIEQGQYISGRVRNAWGREVK